MAIFKTRRLFLAGLTLSAIVVAASVQKSRGPSDRSSPGKKPKARQPQNDRPQIANAAVPAEGLRVRSGQVVANASFSGNSYAAIRVNQPTDNLLVEKCTGSDLFRFLDDTSSNNAVPASLTNFILRQITASDLRRGMTRIRYASHAGLIEDIVATASINPDEYCVGFALDDSAYDIVYRRTRAEGFAVRSQPAGEYWNGDGFADERGNRAIKYLSCVAVGNSDGGFDLKSTDVLVAGCTARGNKRNYRLWGTGRLEGCRSEDPRTSGGTGRPAHFSFHGGSAKFVIDQPIVRADASNTAPVFLFNNDQPAVVEIRNADIIAPGAPLIVNENVAPIITFVPPLGQQRIQTKS